MALPWEATGPRRPSFFSLVNIIMSNESPEPMDLDSQEPEKSEMQLAYEEAKEVAAKGDNDKAIRM